MAEGENVDYSGCSLLKHCNPSQISQMNKSFQLDLNGGNLMVIWKKV